MTRLALRLGLLTLAAAPSLAQQDLYGLGRFNKIWRIDGYDTAAPTLTEITTWGLAANGFPVGLERDPVSGDFFVLVRSEPFDPEASHVLRVDPGGATTIEASYPGLQLEGLDRTWDGHLVSIEGGDTIARLDLAAGTFELRPMTAFLDSSFTPLAIDARGMLLSEDGEDTLRIDPISGQVAPTGLDLPLGSGVMGMEITADDVIYTSGLAADIHRYDPAVGAWVNLLPTWNVMSNCYDLCFTQVVDGKGFEAVCSSLPNSTGLTATLELLGTSAVVNNDLELTSANLPTGVFGYYLLGPTAGSFPVGSGELCIASPVYRFNSNVLNSGGAGTMRMMLDLNSLPGHGNVQAGDSLIFQLWHRDNVGGSSTTNFSAAVRVQFQ